MALPPVTPLRGSLDGARPRRYWRLTSADNTMAPPQAPARMMQPARRMIARRNQPHGEGALESAEEGDEVGLLSGAEADAEPSVVERNDGGEVSCRAVVEVG